MLSTHAVGARRLPHLQVLDLSVQLLGGEGLAGVGTRTAAAARDVLEGLEAGLGGAVLVSCADLAADRSVCLYEGRGLLAVLHRPDGRGPRRWPDLDMHSEWPPPSS